MAGDEEVRARATLQDMARRISRGPHVALGIAELATPEQVRAAFLELTKQFHPARFGRLSTDIQKMSTEVFLGIKSAHDAMLRALGAPTKPGRTVTGAIPVLAAEGSQSMRAQPQPPPPPATRAPSGQIPPIRPGSPPLARPGTPPQRVPTPVHGIPITRPGSPPLRPSSPAVPSSATPPRPAAPAFDEQAGLEVAKALLARRDWGAAAQALQALANRVPQSKPYRALLYYAHGRIAQASGKADDATLEFQRALQLDADLREARTALAEVQRKR